MDVLVTYDIADTAGTGGRRLRAVAEICEAFGVRAQFSVFECRVSPSAFVQMVSELESAIDTDVDSVHIYRFNGKIQGSRMSLGATKHHDLGEPWVF